MIMPIAIQVTERLDSDNLNREIRGLEMARKRILVSSQYSVVL